jgi:sugar phosphate permease
MAADLDLNIDNRFNWALCIFYVVYLLVEVPSNILLKRIGPRFYLPLLVVGFGLVSMCMAFVRSFAGLMVARSFLGVFEGGAMPGMAFYLSTLYKREELLFRIGIYVSAASMAGAFGGLLATGLSRIPPWGAGDVIIQTWRNIFFFEGIITMIAGLLAPIWLPGGPGSCKFLSERQRRIATERLVREHKANAEEQVNSEHVKKAVFCIHNYTCAFAFFLINITVQGLSVFMPTILSDLNWTATKAQLLTVPPYAAACIIAVGIAYISDKTKRRGIYLASFALLTIIGFSLLRWHTDVNVRYMAVFFVTIGAFPGGPGFLSWALNSKSPIRFPDDTITRLMSIVTDSAGPAVQAVTSAYVVSLGTIGGIVAT